MSLGQDVKVTGTLAAANDEVDISQPTSSTIAINLVISGTNTTVFEATVDEGASPTWVAVRALNVNTGLLSSSAVASGLFKVDSAGYTRFRVRCSSYSSGSVVVTLNSSVAPSNALLLGAGLGGFDALPQATLTRGANTTAYTAQDEVGTGSTSPCSFAVSRLSGGSGLILGACLTYSNNPAAVPALRLLLFSSTVTAAGDNVALALSDADAGKFIGLIDFTNTQAGGSATSANVMASGTPDGPIPFTTDTVYGVLITTNAFTPIANSETIQITLRTDQN